eukprot:1374943-Rhodomonas_salina.2
MCASTGPDVTRPGREPCLRADRNRLRLALAGLFPVLMCPVPVLAEEFASNGCHADVLLERNEMCRTCLGCDTGMYLGVAVDDAGLIVAEDDACMSRHR